MAMNPGLNTWNLDDCAECLSIPKQLSTKLWSFVSSDQEPIEVPDGSSVNCLANHWSKFTADEQKTLNEAFAKYSE